jgi:ketosteroid isomerase-like protein
VIVRVATPRAVRTGIPLVAYGDLVHDTVTRYFDAMSRHDWTELRSCLSDGFSRVGPYESHAWTDPESYLAFLAELLPTIKGQRVEITRAIEEGPFVHVDATETIEVDGSPHAVRVGVTFTLDRADRIEHVEVFVRRFSTMETGAP